MDMCILSAFAFAIFGGGALLSGAWKLLTGKGAASDLARHHGFGLVKKWFR